MAPRNADATRKRILDAATAEFARHGLAGARVDRIAEAADANKGMIYAYYGSKDELFDVVLETVFRRAHEAVPFRPDDLVGYASALFDYLTAHPDHVRLDAWRRLERPAPADVETASYGEDVDALAAVRRDWGKDGRFSATDVLIVVIALAGAWVTAPAALRDLVTTDAEHRRELVAGAIGVLVASQDGP